MANRIEGGLSTQLNPFGPQLTSTANAGQALSIGAQVQQTLFGRPKPPVLDPARFPQLAEQLALLQRVKKKLAAMAGDKDADYQLVLADGTIATIDEAGVIYVGAGFLSAGAGQEALLAGVLAHEIGHRPKRWDQYRTQRQLSREELQLLCRHEETRADLFAGKALAELGLSPEPMIAFLERLEDRPHPEYFPARVRGEVIREAFNGQAFRAHNRRKLFPEFDRMTAPKGHLGEY